MAREGRSGGTGPDVPTPAAPRVLTGATLDDIGAGVITLLVQPLLRPGEKIRAIIPEDHVQRRFHIVTQQRCLCFSRRQQNIAYEFEVRTVVRAELTQDDISHRADVECADGTFHELRAQGAHDARVLGTAIVRACDEALHDVDTLSPAESADPRADRMLRSRRDRWSVTVSREQVRFRDVSGVLEVLAPMLTSPRLARRGLESVVVELAGYDDRPEDQWEILEVRTFLQHLDAQFPYWFYFLDKQSPGLFAIARSVLPVDFTADKLGERLTRWWMPAMRQVLQFADLGEDIDDILVQRSLTYLRQTPGEPVTPSLPDLTHPDDEPFEADLYEPLDAAEVMGEMAGLLGGLPVTWRPGSETGLLVFLWSVLDEKGLVRHQTQVEHIRAVASLLALHRLKSLFYAQAFGDGAPEEDAGPDEKYVSPARWFIGDYPRAAPFWIGVHAGSDATFDARIDPDDGTDWIVEALDELVRNQYDEVVSTLRRTLGEDVLLAALLTSSTGDARYPVPEPVVEQVLNGGLGDMGDVRDWLLDQGR